MGDAAETMAREKIYRSRSEKSRPPGPEGKGEEREKDHIISPSSDKLYMVFHVGAVMGETLWSQEKGRSVYALVGRGQRQREGKRKQRRSYDR